MPDGTARGSRSRILEVAEGLFASRGFTGVGMRQVALAVGLSKSSLFHHFPTKQALYREILAAALGRLETALEPALRSGTPPQERLAAWADAFGEVLEDNPATSKLCLRSLFGELAGAGANGRAGLEPEATLARLVGDFERLMAEGIAAGDFREVSPSHLAPTLIGTVLCHFTFGAVGPEGAGPGTSLLAEAATNARAREVRELVQNALCRA